MKTNCYFYVSTRSQIVFQNCKVILLLLKQLFNQIICAMRTTSCSLYNCIVSVQRPGQNYNHNTAYCSNGQNYADYAVISRFGKGEIHRHIVATPRVYPLSTHILGFLFLAPKTQVQVGKTRYSNKLMQRKYKNKAMPNFVWAPQLLQTLCKFQRKSELE